MSNSASVSRLLGNKNHRPDILDCIANLSNDEVFTPPKLADRVLDILPAEVWKNPELKWLDPASKSGIFLRQIATRLMVGLKEAFPDETKRRQHIFHNMLYGMAITELTSLMTRRSLYTSKDANGGRSIAQFDNDFGNVFYENRDHTWRSNQCIYCGLNQKEETLGNRDSSQEKHAYQFIHLEDKEINEMKFDVIVGNPPYQLGDGGFGASAMPIYQKFVESAKKLNPKYMAFIIPSRWFTSGKGLDDFRTEMLADRHIKVIYDYPNASDCFPGVEIKGGVMYFIWDSSYDGDCEIHTILGDEELGSMKRALNEFDIFVRYNAAIPILEKVRAREEETLDKVVSPRKPFGLATNFDDFDEIDNPDKIKIYANKQTGFIRRERVQAHKELIDKHKVLLPKASEGSGGFPNRILGRPIVADTPSCCTETYLVAGAFDTEIEAENYAKFIKTRFLRFLVSIRKITQDSTAKVFAFVPNLPMTEEWTDEKLYARYGITLEEQAFIASMIKEME